ncbi:hypothetical protein MN2019_11955 [Mycolicibacterium neoaurum]|uniref:hypothetical protein n=1 Tax=Mycolicibacterium neoaurum TaxID=1795 RepID=UPI001BCBB452|nr:hypothetical protein [Mycolicibacterium neoaurum]QVI29936.1 hypothetical protein MN2019_11955 [Mycolicibacterium neoaurum]
MTDNTDATEDITDDTAEADATEATTDVDDTTETFSRDYVTKLRDENAKLRVRAQGADELRHRLHSELVRATGLLADPADLEYSEDHLTDPDTLTAAINELVAAKPHLRSRTVQGDVGQGSRGTGEEPVSLLGLLKGRV